MARDVDPAYLAAITGKVVYVAYFAEFAFASGTVRMWTGVGPKTWLGETWLGAGDLGGISPVDESSEIGASGLAFTLSGIPSSTLALALGDKYRKRPARLWRTVHAPDWSILAGVQIFGGRMDIMEIDDQGDHGTITLQAESKMVDLRRARTRRYTAAEQQALFAGDQGCAFVAGLAEKPLNWGIPDPSAATNSFTSGSGSYAEFIRSRQNGSG